MNGNSAIRTQIGCQGVDWQALKDALVEDDFDNGRTPEEYEESARNSFANAFAFDGDRIIGNARVLSDGVCNAYIVDVWTHRAYRRRGVATKMMQALLELLEGQHVYLFTDDQMDFYRSLGFKDQPMGMGMVVGKWLKRYEP